MPVALELLAPAKNKDIGIAAIDCGADAVYIAGPSFGAREAAGNSFEDIRVLCDYAHRYGARIYLTLNTIIYNQELSAARTCMQEAAQAGCDALIVQDLGLLSLQGLPPMELHASTQCNIRTKAQARFLESLGFSRLVLARELSLAQIRDIAASVSCEIESFVHGALCVSYSGQCYLSQYLTGRSANRGSCIQACRSRYDLFSDDGTPLQRNKSLLSLKDLSLKDRMADMARAGVTSFKIEGRLKNISYVRNVVRSYSDSLDAVIASSSGLFCRSSFGSPRGGFTPNISATFNRGYTGYFIDGVRSSLACMEHTTSIGEPVGTVKKVLSPTSFEISPLTNLQQPLTNGDGLCFLSPSGQVTGLRADVVQGHRIRCTHLPEMTPGTRIYRNYNHSFEKAIDASPPERLMRVELRLSAIDDRIYALEAVTEYGATHTLQFTAPAANDAERAAMSLKTAFSKKSGIYLFELTGMPRTALPFLPVSQANALRREMAAHFEKKGIDMAHKKIQLPIKTEGLVPPEQTVQINCANSLSRALYERMGITPAPAYELQPEQRIELMRCKYCIRHELHICPRQQGKREKARPLYLVNNARRLKAVFDCARCEMIICTPDDDSAPDFGLHSRNQ